MTNRNADSIQGDGCIPPPPSSGPPDQLRSRAGNTVFKSGPLFISSKGIGWTSWKKRWFILTRTSLVFFRSDPSIIPQKGSEVNLTLGGIDLNNSGSVVIKADKKLLTVLFPDGRDGRAFTLKAETMEDLYEWKDALENALTQAPSAALVMGQNGIFKNDQPEALDGSLEQLKDKQPMKSMVIGRPILLALEDVDGSPTFLEKSLKFLEEHGVKVEGILRQAADVDDVELRVREYEQGKTEFSAEEDPHVIADCVKHVLRELPSSPVPASCCNALLEACKMDRGVRVSAMRTAICETFPEPNRRLLQRILLMMQSVASNKVVNRMSSSAVAACMAPLLLRPLLAGDCELETDFDVGGDGSVQLLQAAAAANHAQAIVITLLEEYDKIFGECTALTPDMYSDSEVSGSEEASDYEESYEGDELDESSHDSYSTMIEDAEHASIGSGSENGNTKDSDSYDQKEKKNLSMESIEYTLDDELEIQKLENAKTDLQSKIAEEAKRNAVLQASLETRKEVLHARRLALEQDVAGLQEQLQRERGLRRIMEAGLESPQGHVHFSANIDEKTKADIEEIAREESEITNLKQKFDDLGAKINQQREQNNGSDKDQLHLSQQTPIHHKKLGYKRDQDKQKETETTTPSHLSQRSTRNKDNHVDETCRNNDSKQERQTLPNKHPPQTQQLDKTRNSNSKSAEPLDGSSVDSLTGKNIASTNCKKPGTRAEGPNSTTSALTKLTTRLNFLKERRTQIANELQNFDKGRSSTKQTHGQEKGNGPEHRQSLQYHDKDKTLPLPKTQHSQNHQKNAELESNPPLQNTDNWAIEWDHTNKNQENHKKSDGQSSNRVLDRGRRSDGESVQNQDRVRSEGQSHNPPRINSR